MVLRDAIMSNYIKLANSVAFMSNIIQLFMMTSKVSMSESAFHISLYVSTENLPRAH